MKPHSDWRLMNYRSVDKHSSGTKFIIQWDLIFTEVFREKCCSPILDKHQTIYSNGTKQSRSNHCELKNDHLFLFLFLEISFERYQTILENFMQCGRITIPILIIDRSWLYFMCLFLTLNILNQRWQNPIKRAHR